MLIPETVLYCTCVKTVIVNVCPEALFHFKAVREPFSHSVQRFKPTVHLLFIINTTDRS